MIRFIGALLLALLVPVQGWATITEVQTIAVTSIAASAATITVVTGNYAQNLTSGSTLIAALIDEQGTGIDCTSTVSDPTNGTWTCDHNYSAGKGVVFFRVASNTSTSTPTITGTWKAGSTPINTSGSLKVWEISCSPACAKGATAGETDTPTDIASLSLTTTAANSAIFAAVGHNGGLVGTTPGSGFGGFTHDYRNSGNNGYGAAQHTINAGAATTDNVAFASNGNTGSTFYIAAIEYTSAGSAPDTSKFRLRVVQ